MGFFYNIVFGSPKGNRDNIQYSVSKEDIKRIVSSTKVKTLSTEEVELISNTIEKARKGNGKISMAQVDDALRPLMNKNKISKSDYKGMMQQFGMHVVKKKYR